MKILWLAPLVQYPGRPNAFRPLMDEVANAEGNFPNVWQTTTANAALRNFRTASANAFCIELLNATQVSGSISYTKF